MDFHCLEALLGLPEFRVIAQVFGPQQLEVHLQRREDHLVCPRCQACCSHVKESRRRRLRPWETSATFGERVKWTERLYHQVRQEFLRGCPCKELARRYGLSERTV